MINKIDNRIGECYKQLTALIHSETLNNLLLSKIYKNLIEEQDDDIKAQYDNIAEALPDELLLLVSNDKIKAVHNYLISHYFVSLITIFETFLFDLQKLVLLDYPLKISNITIEYKDILDADNKDQIVSFAIDKYLMSLSYKKPLEYKKSFLEIISAHKNFLNDEWILFTEMKARRDLGVHNNWFINDTYVRKVKEVGFQHRKDNNYLFPTEEYFDESSETLVKIINIISDHCRKKFV